MSLDIYPLYLLQEKSFERMINHLLFFEYGVEIKFVDDRSGPGDKGLDAYIGKINNKLHAFQSKFFPKIIGASQQSQIRKSLKTATHHHKLESWTLCVPKDLDPEETTWLDGHIKRKYPNLVYDVLGITKISALLNKHFHVAEAFFRVAQMRQEPTSFEKTVGMAFPKTKHHTGLVGRIDKTIKQLGIEVFFVDDQGNVESL